MRFTVYALLACGAQASSGMEEPPRPSSWEQMHSEVLIGNVIKKCFEEREAKLLDTHLDGDENPGELFRVSDCGQDLLEHHEDRIHQIIQMRLRPLEVYTTLHLSRLKRAGIEILHSEGTLTADRLKLFYAEAHRLAREYVKTTAASFPHHELLDRLVEKLDRGLASAAEEPVTEEDVALVKTKLAAQRADAIDTEMEIMDLGRGGRIGKLLRVVPYLESSHPFEWAANMDDALVDEARTQLAAFASAHPPE